MDFEAVQICSSILREIHLLCNNFCPCQIEEYIIVPSKLTKDIHLVPVSERPRIRLEDLACAVLQKQKIVEDTEGYKRDVADIVSNQEVYYCLPSSIIYELFTDDHHLDKKVYYTIKGVCKDIMKEYSREDPVSSPSVRNHLNMYSLFSSCNMQVSAFVCSNEKLNLFCSKELVKSHVKPDVIDENTQLQGINQYLLYCIYHLSPFSTAKIKTRVT